MSSAPASSCRDGLSPARDRERIDRVLAAFLAESRRRYAANPRLRPIFDRSAEFVLNGGKRLRPRTCLASYRIIAGAATPPRPAWLAASSLELFHAFMLAHDDLIDNSVVRRERPTLHEAIRLDMDIADGPCGRKRAADLGLVAGDLLCTLGMGLLARAGLAPAALGPANRLVADMLLETGLGEALDILYDDCPLDRLDEAEIVEAYLRKTARYSVSGPLVLGATLAGAPGQVVRALDRFGDLLGLGYQLQNDLDGLASDPETGDHSDLDGGKRTLVLWTAHRLLGPSARRQLVDALAAPPGIDRRRRLRALIVDSGAIDASRARLHALQREAVDVLRDAGFDPERRRAFVALTEMLPQRQAAPASTANGLPHLNGNGHAALAAVPVLSERL